jgi:hypothetical protein
MIGAARGQMLLRLLDYDAFVTTKDVTACLRDAGHDRAAPPTLKRDVAKEQLNARAKETGLPYPRLSLICAFSIGKIMRAGTSSPQPAAPRPWLPPAR